MEGRRGGGKEGWREAGMRRWTDGEMAGKKDRRKGEDGKMEDG